MDDQSKKPDATPRRADRRGLPTQSRRSGMTRIILWAPILVFALTLSTGCSEPDQSSAGDGLQIFELSIEHRSVEIPNDTIRVREGQRVRLDWLSDETTSIHLHGYDIEASIQPGRRVRWDFEANLAGRFPVEAHGFGHSEKPTGEHDHSDHHHHSDPSPKPATESTQTTLLYLEVHPH